MTLLHRVSDWFFARRHHKRGPHPLYDEDMCSCGDWWPCEARNVRRRSVSADKLHEITLLDEKGEKVKGTTRVFQGETNAEPIDFGYMPHDVYLSHYWIDDEYGAREGFIRPPRVVAKGEHVSISAGMIVSVQGD